MIKILMVVISSFPLDVRVRRESEALIEAGYAVDVICRTARNEPRRDKVKGINVFRIALNRKRAGKFQYLFEYAYFFVRAFLKVNLLYFKNRYDIIHVHNMPDFLVFTAIIPKMLGAKVLLDLHDPMPELYTSMSAKKEKSLLYKMLIIQEKLCIGFANHIITPNIAFKELFAGRSCPAEKVTIVMNSPDEKIFRNDITAERNDNSFRVMYHGTIVERHGLDIALKAINKIRDKIPNLKFLIFGDGNFIPAVKKLITELSLQNIVELRGTVIVDQIALTIPAIDVGVIPNRINSFTKKNFPVRIFEYLVMGKPVIVPRTDGILDYFDEDSIFYFEAGNTEDLANKILEVYFDTERKDTVVKNGIKILDKFRWEKQKNNLINIVNNLCGKNNSSEVFNTKLNLK